MGNHDRRLDRLESTLPHLPPLRPEPSPTADFLLEVLQASIEAGASTDTELVERLADIAARGGEVDADLNAAVWLSVAGR